MNQKKITAPTKGQYEKAAIEVAFSYAPQIWACQKCCWPVLDGYCCTTCGDTNPSEPFDTVSAT